jgi:xanthine/uracil permease
VDKRRKIHGLGHFLFILGSRQKQKVPYFMASTFFYPECSGATLATSIGTVNGKSLRSLCTQTSMAFILSACTVAVAILYSFNFARCIVNIPIWIGLFGGLIYSPLRLHFDNVSELAFISSEMSKNEWVNYVSADSRVRLSVIASLTAAFIVSANAWMTRIENSK